MIQGLRLLIILISICSPGLSSAAPPLGVKISTTDINFGTIVVRNNFTATVSMDKQGRIFLEGGAIESFGIQNLGKLSIQSLPHTGVSKAKISFEKRIDIGNGVIFKPIATKKYLISSGRDKSLFLYGELEIPARVPKGDYSGMLRVNLDFY